MKLKFIGKKYDYKIDRDKLLKTYADSINKISITSDIPAFLFNECLEHDVTLRRGYHSSESVRWDILKKVTNRNALQIILQSNDDRLKTYCKKYREDKKLKINYAGMSFYDLLQKRLKSLK
ncbi:MAG TPA: hypothetical protein VD996_07320 [Chitinophagaceae bacterium]|nr:hypothetical protein [Chitinophagaceae bacterium]